MKPIHIMRWAPQDWRTSRVRARSARTGDRDLRLVYLELLFALHEAGGSLADDVAELEDVLMLPAEVVGPALEKLVKLGSITRAAGRLTNPRVSRQLSEELEFREQQAEHGRRSGRARVGANPQASPNQPSAKPEPTRNPPLPTPTPEPTPTPLPAPSPLPAPLPTPAPLPAPSSPEDAGPPEAMPPQAPAGAGAPVDPPGYQPPTGEALADAREYHRAVRENAELALGRTLRAGERQQIESWRQAAIPLRAVLAALRDAKHPEPGVTREPRTLHYFAAAVSEAHERIARATHGRGPAP